MIALILVSMQKSARPGLRERKKQQTRLAISDVATRLFIARGFDNVTVAEVAEAADVSVNTIFNYFSTKEELFFDRGDEVKEEPARMVRARRPGEPVVDALYRQYREAAAARTATPSERATAGRNLKGFIATIDASPALRLRERLLLEQSEQRLAEALAAETGAKPDDPAPRVVAALITGLEWMLIQEFRTRLLRGEPEAKIRAALRRTAARGFKLLRDGVGDYGARAK
jgi:AcrR family transcriptional regulator